MDNILEVLKQREGHYEGSGVNHEKQEFKGIFSLMSIIGNHGMEVSSKAIGRDGTNYHEERTIIALDENHHYKMWSLNNNAPMILEFEIRNVSESEMIFGFNDPKDKSKFREEIKLELVSEKEIGYHYSWGMPNGEFEYRSGLRMTLLENEL